ncbi:1-acyl-sn-glycerol-3-phosphate acyltransferase [Rubrobacter tropicus]|uniref:1-acyl-sn-glycerol-3-phosphate acyltransferase n=1 Tax=Rubrobacter tropicus TaxID=2653851 RepID=A0A6G8Q9A1_9ACTN|nr:lysophospholipid acyltransferase family protein [Rubrobacter tropicus]QIN83012.1 1-acyl-sn-glycerol-3-phosphate acyltransferase [Rubrobacter tropicus]
MTAFEGRSTPTRMSRRYDLFRRFMILLCRLLFGLTIEGMEKVPKGGPLVVAANHTQYPDPVLVCMAVPRRMQWMAKKQLFEPPYKKFFEFIGSFPVDREGGGRAGVRAALAFLKEGWALGIFPEGTHRDDGTAREAKSGAVLLAIRGGAPVLPVFVGKIPGPRARLRGGRLRLIVGDPMTLDAGLRGGQAYREAADDVLRTIYSLPKQNRKGQK